MGPKILNHIASSTAFHDPFVLFFPSNKCRKPIFLAPPKPSVTV